MTFRFFLSHSSPTDAAKHRLSELGRAIEHKAQPHAPVQVLYDLEQITAGDEWRRRIAFMLHVCDGGAVLLDEQAVASKWVFVESAFLSLRQKANGAFTFIPVSFLDDAALKKAVQGQAGDHRSHSETAWDIVDLASVQYVRGRSVGHVASAIVTALRDRGPLQAGGSAADLLADQLVPWLAEAGPQALQNLAGTLDDAGAYLTTDARARAAMAIVRHMLSTGCLTSTLELMKILGTPFPDARRRQILHELSPLCEAMEGAAVLTARRTSGGYVHASVCATRPSFTVPLYVRRAHLAVQPPTYFAIENTLGSFESLRASLRHECRRRYLLNEPDITDEDVDEWLGTSNVYVWVPGPVDGDVLALLDAAYPKVSFIVHHDEPPVDVPNGVVPITPMLLRAEEDAIYKDHRYAMSALSVGGSP
ncbi:MAG: hypothetical protein ACJ74O_16540 [Frankiaceae bacterium]